MQVRQKGLWVIQGRLASADRETLRAGYHIRCVLELQGVARVMRGAGPQRDIADSHVRSATGTSVAAAASAPATPATAA